MGKQKLTYDFVKNSFYLERYILLSEEYINCRTKLKYKCSKGHIHYISWDNWKKGHRCPFCAGQGKPTIGYIREMFIGMGYNLLTKKYVNSDSYLEYICSEGHNHSMKWNNWRIGRRCPSCKAINHSKRTSGSGHHNWKGGITKFNKELRNFIKHIGWDRKVLKRDDYTCRKCNTRGGYLIAHHLIPLSTIKKYFNIKNMKDVYSCSILYDINNGLTMCKECHKKHHDKIREDLKSYDRANIWNSEMVCEEPFIMETLCRNLSNSRKPLTGKLRAILSEALIKGTCND